MGNSFMNKNHAVAPQIRMSYTHCIRNLLRFVPASDEIRDAKWNSRLLFLANREMPYRRGDGN